MMPPRQFSGTYRKFDICRNRFVVCHLTSSQRAAIAVDVEALLAKEAAERQRAAGSRGVGFFPPAGKIAVRRILPHVAAPQKQEVNEMFLFAIPTSDLDRTLCDAYFRLRSRDRKTVDEAMTGIEASMLRLKKYAAMILLGDGEIAKPCSEAEIDILRHYFDELREIEPQSGSSTFPLACGNLPQAIG
jgi:hypothetical protein